MQTIIGESDALSDMLSHISRVAPIDRPVIVIGERGSGKELAAERLHYLSPRWSESLQRVNCAALSEDLLESELFGHEAGAFTGATRTHQGRFERAHGGTLFLDELGTMPVRVQEKLLRVLERGEFERVGGKDTINVDVRVVGATNANLRQLAREGKFREDLLDRLAFDVVHVPALRERKEDIPALVEYFAVKITNELDRNAHYGFSDDALNTLIHHNWPGNVRELKNTVDRSVVHWQEEDQPIAEVIIDPFRHNAEVPQTVEPVNSTHNVEAANVGKQKGSVNFTESVRDYELKLLREALLDCEHNQKNTAKYLGLTYHQLRALIRKYKTYLTADNYSDQ